jgi:hypothetical protein
MGTLPALRENTYRTRLAFFEHHRLVSRDLAVPDAGCLPRLQLRGRLRTADTFCEGNPVTASDKKSASSANAMRDAAPSRYSAGLQIG